MAAKIKKARGRPKVEPEAKRSLSLPPIKVNEVERIRIEARAQAASVPVSTWVRYAAQEIDPPKRNVIPPLNREAWLQLGDELNALRRLKWTLETEGERAVVTALSRVEEELKILRNGLIGAATE
ncbi:MAG: hypothetical protein MSG64_12155 [Pyrinomonadaceae bacterium MAG19_C2-C3]|nr:hypothetical protein [Pyrinomonadaceae bacterium MAG19_C2-C3]